MTAAVPRTITNMTPRSSIRSTNGVNSPRMRVEASSASMIPSFSRSNRSSSASWRFDACTSIWLARLSSATALSEPERRRFSLEACLISRENRRAT